MDFCDIMKSEKEISMKACGKGQGDRKRPLFRAMAARMMPENRLHNRKKGAFLMKRLRYLVLGVLLISFSACLLSCKEEGADKSGGDTSTVTGTEARLTQEQLLQEADLVVKGTVTAKNGETMSNPDGALKDAEGYQILNQLITDYTVEIEEIYKGSYSGDTIRVKTASGDGVNADLAAYDEEGNALMESDPEQSQLAVNEDRILLLSYTDTGHEESTGYFPTLNLGYLKPDGSGNYTNGEDPNNVTVNPETLADEIAEACAE